MGLWLMTNLPEGPEAWQYYHQNLARLWLKGQARSVTEGMLAEIKRIQGDKQEQIMRDFLNHEKQAIADGVALVKPQSVIDSEANESQLNSDGHESRKQDIAQSEAFKQRLAS